MTTNYSVIKAVANNALTTSDLPDSVAASIVKKLGSIVAINNIIDPDHNLVVGDLAGRDIVFSDQSGAIDLNSTTTFNNASKLDALIFNTNEGIDLTFNGGKAADSFKGWVVSYGGDDTINLSGWGLGVSSGDGDDSITTGGGHDSILAGDGADTITSGNGNDTINAGDGDDSIDSGKGNDSILTGDGDDLVSTGDGNDTVITGQGSDSIDTGAGNDSVTLGGSIGDGIIDVTTGKGADIVKLALGYTGDATLDGNGFYSNGFVENLTDKAIDKLDLRNVDISLVSREGRSVFITLADESVIEATNFEQFIYDTNGTDSGGTIKTVGIAVFDSLFPDPDQPA